MTQNLDRICNEFLDEVMNLNDLPGLAIGVSASDREFTGVRGFKDLADRVPLETDDIFHCASVSKLFTSFSIMKLIDAGALRLNDRLCDILPNFKIADERFRGIRLWNMLTHTSGLGDVDDYHWYDFETDDESLSRYVYSSEEVLNQSMLWSPQQNPEYLIDDGESCFRYSNIAYEILGQIVSEYSDRMPGSKGRLSYEDFVSEYLLRPAGMTSSTMKTFERPGAPDFVHNDSMAKPHEKEPDRSIGLVEYYPYTRQHSPSSTLTSNVHDLLNWGRYHLAGTEADYGLIWRDYATVPNNGEKMGLGWFTRRQNGFTLHGHEGTDDGFRASFWICPELQTVTVVLSNLSGAPVKKINRRLFSAITQNAAPSHG